MSTVVCPSYLLSTESSLLLLPEVVFRMDGVLYHLNREPGLRERPIAEVALMRLAGRGHLPIMSIGYLPMTNAMTEEETWPTEIIRLKRDDGFTILQAQKTLVYADSVRSWIAAGGIVKCGFKVEVFRCKYRRGYGPTYERWVANLIGDF